jgi:alkylhydroperoxidase/carboxymuconolactone decarboxylase family protein YurZ
MTKREPSYAALLRRLALNDAGALDLVMRGECDGGLDEEVRALTRLASLIASEGSPASYQWAVAVARAAGASEEAIADVLPSVGPVVGVARVASAAPALAAALGIEIDVFDAD